MKIRRILLIATVVIGILCMTTSCTIFDPYKCGVVSGSAAYLGYSKAAEKQDEDFKSKVAELWGKINAIETVDELVSKVDDLEASFDEIIYNDKVPEKIKVTLLKLKDHVMGKIREIMDKTLISNAEALEYIIGVRDGVNQMIELTAEH